MKVFKLCLSMAVCASVILGLASCASGPKVKRVDVNEQIDLSGNWNDTDSRLVSEEMVKDAVSRTWISDFMMQKQNKPRVIVGTVSNKSHEHISTETFTKDLERELLNSGKVTFVADKGQRDEVRDEKADQAENSTKETAKAAQQETGADFMLKGQINTILDEAGRSKVKYYQVELEMINITTNEKIWIGQKKLKKVVKQPLIKI